MKTNRGFTLIEVIVTITLIAIAAALFVAYISTSFTQSPVSSGLVAKQYALIQQMEIITNRYRQDISSGTLNLTNFETYVDGNLYIHSSDLMTITDASNTYTTQQVLVVTLQDGDQTVMSIFTQ